ncbi:hypothetical protein J437_LFUL006841 [Ladona fulva]|uniref:Uncharacterized protein n=1 Tax=Ladona fulva TaxID=123851 RepID=A0A8K0KU77_LADFU|nr:hypothetical protein J437_LFUL006841 [Ladona fulva]
MCVYDGNLLCLPEGCVSLPLYLDRGGKAALLLRIEPVRPGRDDASYECVAENGVGDAVSAEAMLTVYDINN